MSNRLRILLIEDNPGDAELIQELLESEIAPSHEFHCSQRLSHGIEQAKSQSFELAILDLNLPDSNGLNTIEKFKAAAPQIPFLVLTGTKDELTGMQAVKAGAQDYLVKGEFNRHHLKSAVRYAVERDRVLKELKKALERIKTLKGIIPICSYCKKIRDDKGFWERVETYIHEHSDAELSHGICPECLEKQMKELDEIKSDLREIQNE